MPTAHTNPFHLDGRLALVTGAGSGIGLAIARGLARAGARLVINGRNIGKLEQAAATLLAEDIDVVTLPFDVADESAVNAAIATLVKTHGAPDIVVNNAGANLRQPLEAFTVEQWRALQATNLDGPFLVARAIVPAMKQRGRGKIVNVCSLASDLGRPNIVPYAASKGGLKMLTRALAVELAPFNVQVNGLAPGFFDTEMNAPLVADAQFSAWVKTRVPAGRWARPDEIAGAAVFLASPAADFVTGHILYVDGGFSAAY
jgi:gluconate 5-dehydrogenase